ncbi:BQ5605_C003g01924 [Microbotryum silenes-dioicae]|uniref:BQ5605_C003g01924 protein n=1 Tax=Microbotryum silenes-dioicae TaxID=796604 RepID=A0A2X0M3R6_9BASI|nr:BQ5605_C003g01924 [Microbotryum silenes-dioicae]
MTTPRQSVRGTGFRKSQVLVTSGRVGSTERTRPLAVWREQASTKWWGSASVPAPV